MTTTLRRVDARLPLTLLQAMQQLDSPPDLMPDERYSSSFPVRLGRSTVIEEQVRQFRRRARLRRRVKEEEVEALLELISRRRDAAAIFTAAGQQMAGLHLAGLRGRVRRVSRFLPRPLRQRAAVRALRTANSAFLVASDLAVQREPLEIRATDALTARVTGAGVACQIYASLASSLLDRMAATPAGFVHPECQGRGDPRCVWRALPEAAK
jgi:hypothetical protein